LGGLGLEIIRQFVPRGIQRLAVIDLPNDPEKVLGNLVKNVEHFSYRQAPVEDQNALKTAMEAVAKELGGFNLVINSAGIFNERDPAHMIAVNYTGTVNSTLIGLDLMRKDKSGKGGVIMNIASEAGLRTAFGLPIYCGTKHAVRAFTQSLRAGSFNELTGVKFMTICPGVTMTPMVENYKNRTLFPEMIRSMKDAMAQIEIQQPQVVGVTILKALEDGENGAVWACIGGNIRKVHIPEYPEI